MPTNRPITSVWITCLGLVLAACASPTTPPTLTRPSLALAISTATPLPTASPSSTVSPALTATSTPTASRAPTRSPTATATTTVAVTVAPTHTQRPAVRLTNTPTPTSPPLSSVVLPGDYPQAGACAFYEVITEEIHVQVNWCVDLVRVKAGGDMDFHVTWNTTILRSPQGYVTKYPDRDNRNMYLVDNLGNRYDHIATNGAANLGSNVFQGPPTPVTGVFVFPAPPPGASSFSFYDDDQRVVISSIRLVSPIP